MFLCVGASSRRVIEEAAQLRVHQIIASRRQVDIGGGYTGLDQYQLVELVNRLSHSGTDVVRDHGGPDQGAKPDDGIESFDADVDAGFDGLHIDVCKLPREDQPATLVRLTERYLSRRDDLFIQVGGERDEQAHLDVLLRAVLPVVVPRYAVIEAGGYIHADRQCGSPYPVEHVAELTRRANDLGVATVAHNFDWVGRRNRFADVMDAYNVAPEFGQVEVRALLTVLPFGTAQELLRRAYATEAWRRWFDEGEGTWVARAECAVRYVLEEPWARELSELNDDQEFFVRSAIRNALVRG